ncbi:hypothetical protein X798_03553 [Onchocerca flexuosa]|uniref:G_PROTEIN_RECEP_F1_2 domain-containing protein n=1 Tax=Onchocerca flexuosa TaxID=387005 RepID=A0A238BVU2_9BILA|nr:hypothetical protein X798_03553 [Onchocerca flexuosa]
MILKFSVYIAGGLTVFILNILYFTAIIRTKVNRERYGLTGMEFFADALMGFSIALAGGTRIVQIFVRGQNDTFSRLICVIMPHNIFLAWTPNSRCPIFNRLFYGVRISAAAGSVTLYIITLFIVRRYTKRIKEEQNYGSIKISKRQLNFTKTVGLSCFVTASLYILPMIVAFFETSNEMIPNSVYSTIIIISCLNSFSKAIIFGCRTYEIREAVIDLMPGVFQKFGIHRPETANVIEFKTQPNRQTTGF